MAEPTPFRRSEEDGVLTVTFTRDAKLNAVSPAMIEACGPRSMTSATATTSRC